MPRSQDSPESKILQWFRTAPLSTVALILGLAKSAVKEREQHKPGRPRKAVEAPEAPVAAHKAKPAKKPAVARRPRARKTPASSYILPEEAI